MPLPVRPLKPGRSVDGSYVNETGPLSLYRDALKRYNNRSNRLTKVSVTPSGAAISGLGQVQPRQALLREYVSRRLKLRGQVECSDMKMRFGRRWLALAGQRRPAFGAEAPPPAGRRIEPGDRTFGNDISLVPKRGEDGNGCTAVFSTTLAMAPYD
jgi:hypothetical protein